MKCDNCNKPATVHLTAAGSCTITASQPGNANYNPASNVSRTFLIASPPDLAVSVSDGRSR